MPLSIAHLDASGNVKRSCDGCVFIETEPFGKDRTAYRCMSIRQGHYGRVVTTQLQGREPMLYRPAWCHIENNTMTEKTKELGAILRGMNLPAGNVKECAVQLFDIVKNNDQLVDIVLEDIRTNANAVKDCEKQIDAYARTHRGVDAYNAEIIIRKHFGLPDAGPEQDPFGETEETVENVRKPEETKETEEAAFDLSAFL